MSDNDRELLHYGVLGMRWGHHMRREMAATRANRAHNRTKYVKDKVDKTTGPYKRNLADRENTARRTGKKRDIMRAERAKRAGRRYLDRGEKVLSLYEKREKRRDATVRKIDKTISEMGELKIKSVQFDRWLERNPR